jgi:hypothetical protein
MQQRFDRLTCDNNSTRDALHGVIHDSRDVRLPVSFDIGDVQLSFLDQTIDDRRVANSSGNDNTAFLVVAARARVSKTSLACHIESRTGVEAGRSAVSKQRHSAARASHSLKVLCQIIDDSQDTRPVVAVGVELDARASLGKSNAGAIEVDGRFLSNG